MLLQLTCLQRSYENLVLILILLKPCLDVSDSNTTSPPSASESSPEHSPPSMPSLAGRNWQLLSLHAMPEPAQAAQSRPLPETPSWGCSCVAIAAIANITHLSPQVAGAELAPFSLCTQPSWIPVGSKKKKKCTMVHNGAIGDPPSAPCSDVHFWGRFMYFLEAQFIITEVSTSLYNSHAGSEGQVRCYLEKGSASQFISCLIQWGNLRTEIWSTSVYKPKCQEADNVCCKCQSWGIFLFPLKKNQQRFSCYIYAAIHTGSAPLSVNGIAPVHKCTVGILKGPWLKAWVW